MAKCCRKDLEVLMNELQKEPLKEAAILLIYFALKPLYLGASGFLQISDVVLLLSLAYLLVKCKGKVRFEQNSGSAVKVFAFMLVYQSGVNLIWGLITGDGTMSRHDLYYLFNFIAFSGTLLIGQYVSIDQIKRAVGKGSFIAVIITAIGLVFFRGAGSRSTGFFNNPNQLGYFAVIMLTIIALCKDQMTKIEIATVFIISFWATVASLSKAAILAYFAEVVVLIVFYQNNRSVKRLLIEFVLLVLAGGAIYLFFFSDSSFVLGNRTLYQMRYRILYMSQENDSGFAYGRGYARVLEMLPHILWGTGEGAYERFVARHGTEVHSTFISLLTCYGAVGLFGYLAIFKSCMGKGKVFWQNMIAMLGLFLYALTHNGIRNTLLWIIFAMLLLFCKEQVIVSEERQK